jgi:hypothetical protein
LFGRGWPLSEFKYQYFVPTSNVGDIDQVHHGYREAEVRDFHGLRYSPPWPWMLAIAISLTMWAFLGLLIGIALNK